MSDIPCQMPVVMYKLFYLLKTFLCLEIVEGVDGHLVDILLQLMAHKHFFAGYTTK